MNDDVQRRSAEVIAAVYRDRSMRFADRASRLARYGGVVSTGRWVAICAAVVCLVLASSNQAVRALALVGCGLLLAGWAAFEVLRERLRRRQKYYEELSSINKHSSACMRRCWEEMRLPATEVPESAEALADDLDLFGWGSLFHWICRAHTPLGIAALRDWLLAPAEPSVVVERQQAVAELSPELELRQQLELRGRLLAGSSRAFLDWTEGRPWLAERPRVRGVAIVLTVVPSLLVGLMLARVVPPADGFAAIFVASLVNLFFTATFGAGIHEIFRKGSSRHAGVRDYVDLFDLMAHLPGRSSALARLRQAAADAQHGACARLRNLRRIIELSNLRRCLLLYLPLQVFLLWDFHVLALLEKWQRRSSEHARRWFEALGELEALSSLSALAHDNPAWPFPTVEVGDLTGIEALGLGHPLLPDDVRVPNDVTLGPPGTFLFVTGSNMSGKTTLLRALGTNIVLAQAGAPVCATRLRMSPLLLATVMVIDDSLIDGVSMFMAALYRLKDVVDSARRLSGRPDRTLVYLLDEVMRGTNSLEREIAVRKVLGHLLREGAIGGVSSHDVELANSEPLAEACLAVHFRESIENDSQGPRMRFDYKMHPGVATTTNALRLLKLVGLD